MLQYSVYESIVVYPTLSTSFECPFGSFVVDGEYRGGDCSFDRRDTVFDDAFDFAFYEIGSEDEGVTAKTQKTA